MQTDDAKVAKRLQSLEAKARLYDELQKRVNLDDEAANDLLEVDFIAKALDARARGTEQSTTSGGALLDDFSGASTSRSEPLRMFHLSKYMSLAFKTWRFPQGKAESVLLSHNLKPDFLESNQQLLPLLLCSAYL